MTERTNEVLVKLFQDATDHREQMEYLKELYQDNYLFILKVCRKFSAFEEIDDLAQEAFFGLRIAVERYDPDQGVPFVNYAAIWIEQALRRYLENCGHSVRVPTWMYVRIIKYEKVKAKLIQEYGREPSDLELADAMSLTVKQLEKVKMNALVMNTTSLDKTISTENDDITLLDSIPDPVDHYEEISDQMDEDIKYDIIWDEVDRLKENESQIIREYYLNEGTLDDIGQGRGCSSENVRQIRDRALSKLRRSGNIQRYADDYLSARAYNGVGLSSFRNTGTSATERTAIERIDHVIQSQIRKTDRQIRKIKKKHGITLNQFRQNMTDKILRDMKA